ncbi:MAG: hypothetical protein GY822_11895 [Deltaproteobacteria bacterium]|nr:hypothetical protein [Deltaproteobacteria bacterium]
MADAVFLQAIEMERDGQTLSSSTAGQRLPEQSVQIWTALRERHLVDLSDEKVALLVHYRLRLARRQGWGMMALFMGAFTSVIPLVGVIRSATLVALIAALAPCVLGTTVLADAMAWRMFRRMAQDLGLDENGTRYLFRKSLDASRWLEILSNVGTFPTDDEVAEFVRGDE